MSHLFLLLGWAETAIRLAVPDDRWENAASVECSLAREDGSANRKICPSVTVHHKSHKDCSEIVPEPLKWEGGN